MPAIQEEACRRGATPAPTPPTSRARTFGWRPSSRRRRSSRCRRRPSPRRLTRRSPSLQGDSLAWATRAARAARRRAWLYRHLPRLAKGHGGSCQPASKLVTINSGQAVNAQVDVLCHELAHVLVRVDRRDDDPRLGYPEEELVAESVAHLAVSFVGVRSDVSAVPTSRLERGRGGGHVRADRRARRPPGPAPGGGVGRRRARAGQRGGCHVARVRHAARKAAPADRRGVEAGQAEPGEGADRCAGAADPRTVAGCPRAGQSATPSPSDFARTAQGLGAGACVRPARGLSPDRPQPAPRKATHVKPTRKQLAYLKSLAEQTGATFTYPRPTPRRARRSAA